VPGDDEVWKEGVSSYCETVGESDGMMHCGFHIEPAGGLWNEYTVPARSPARAAKCVVARAAVGGGAAIVGDPRALRSRSAGTTREGRGALVRLGLKTYGCC
jgi:hypothetical protein